MVKFTSDVTAILMVGTPNFLGHNSPISAPLPKTDKPQDHQRKHNNSHRKKPMGNPPLCTSPCDTITLWNSGLPELKSTPFSLKLCIYLYSYGTTSLDFFEPSEMRGFRKR